MFRPYGTSCWQHKAVAMMGAATGKNPGAAGTGRAQSHLRQCFVFLEMTAVTQPEVTVTGAAEAFDENGDLKNDFIVDKIKKQLATLVDLARRLQ